MTKTYDAKQIEAVLVTCASCGKSHYMTAPQERCVACRRKSLDSNCGLSLDMADVEAIRTDAAYAHDEDMDWTADRLSRLADNMERMIRDVGMLRAALGLNEVSNG